MSEVIETLTSKKINEYGTNLNDFKIESELTVEITLSEYRELIKSKATKEAEIDKANKDKYTRESENQKLRNQNKYLEMKLFEYRKRYGEIEENKEEIEEEN